MIAAGQNVKRLMTFGPTRPSKPAMVAAVRPPERPSQHPLYRHRTIPARRFSTRWGVLRRVHFQDAAWYRAQPSSEINLRPWVENLDRKLQEGQIRLRDLGWGVGSTHFPLHCTN